MSSHESISASSPHSSIQRFEAKDIFTPHKIITRSMTRKGTPSTQVDTDSIPKKTRRRRRKTTTVRRRLDFDESNEASRLPEPQREDIIQNLTKMSVSYWSKGIENIPQKQISDLPQFPFRC